MFQMHSVLLLAKLIANAELLEKKFTLDLVFNNTFISVPDLHIGCSLGP
jgi:hypothetical protein